jgi:hypothetical protein
MLNFLIFFRITPRLTQMMCKSSSMISKRVPDSSEEMRQSQSLNLALDFLKQQRLIFDTH